MRIYAPGEEETDRALESTWSDFEDALLYQTALSLKARCIITRNTRDFILSSLPVRTCRQFFSWMEQKNHLAYEELMF
ncbi:PIN domain-containing protein [Atopobium sp. oral taxon 199]|uniref:PIN domain-containing protein n=1 Tax=Atopobium sp. oral taxon 199 TaxID=712156 RepID=UPI0035109CA5